MLYPRLSVGSAHESLTELEFTQLWTLDFGRETLDFYAHVNAD